MEQSAAETFQRQREKQEDASPVGVGGGGRKDGKLSSLMKNNVLYVVLGVTTKVMYYSKTHHLLLETSIKIVVIWTPYMFNAVRTRHINK